MEGRPHTQEEVEQVILDVVYNGSAWLTAEITKAVKARLPLVYADRIRAAKRENESKIDQIIANALQAKRRLCRQELIEREGRGVFRITSLGKLEQAKFRAEIDAMAADLDRLLDND